MQPNDKNTSCFEKKNSFLTSILKKKNSFLTSIPVRNPSLNQFLKPVKSPRYPWLYTQAPNVLSRFYAVFHPSPATYTRHKWYQHLICRMSITVAFDL